MDSWVSYKCQGFKDDAFGKRKERLRVKMMGREGERERDKKKN